jgi:hypothetical protein
VRRLGQGAGARVVFALSSSLQADELLGMASHLDRRRFPECVAAGSLGAVASLAVWRGEPVVCLDPAAPLPPALLASALAEGTDALAPGGPEDPDAR